MAILKMENMTWKEIRDLDKVNSVIIVAFSPIEEHGPHLPLGTDYISAKVLLEEVVNSLHEYNNTCNYIIHPPFPIGYNECVMNYPGTIFYRAKTIENLIIDFGASIKRCGFSKIVLINHHLDLGHIKAIENAKEVLKEEYEIKLLEVASSVIYSEKKDKGNKLIEGIHVKNEVHADFRETSFMLYKYPELVRKCYVELKPVYLDVEEFFKAGKRFWEEADISEGYIGSPSQSTAEAGKKLFSNSVETITNIILDFIMNNKVPELSNNIKNAMKHMILR